MNDPAIEKANCVKMMNPIFAFVSGNGSNPCRFSDALDANGLKLAKSRDANIGVTYLPYEIKNPSSFALQLSGLIVEGGRIVGAHPPQFNRNPSLQHIFDHISEYNIYPIHYGTTITLYYHNEKWCIATRRTVGGAVFRGIAIEAVFESALLAYGLTPSPFDATEVTDVRDKLDKNKSYSFVIYGKELQEFDVKLGNESETRGIWYICSRDMNTIEVDWSFPPFFHPDMEIKPLRDEDNTFARLNEKIAETTMEKVEQDPGILIRNGMGFILRKKNQHVLDKDVRQNNIIIKNHIYTRIDQLIGNVDNIDHHMIKIIKSQSAFHDFNVLFPNRPALAFYNSVRSFVCEYLEAADAATGAASIACRLCEKYFPGKVIGDVLMVSGVVPELNLLKLKIKQSGKRIQTHLNEDTDGADDQLFKISKYFK